MPPLFVRAALTNPLMQVRARQGIRDDPEHCAPARAHAEVRVALALAARLIPYCAAVRKRRRRQRPQATADRAARAQAPAAVRATGVTACLLCTAPRALAPSEAAGTPPRRRRQREWAARGTRARPWAAHEGRDEDGGRRRGRAWRDAAEPRARAREAAGAGAE